MQTLFVQALYYEGFWRVLLGLYLNGPSRRIGGARLSQFSLVMAKIVSGHVKHITTVIADHIENYSDQTVIICCRLFASLLFGAPRAHHGTCPDGR